MTKLEQLITSRLKEFYAELYTELSEKYPDNSKVEIQLAVDSVVEESLDWEGYVYSL